MPNPGRKRLWRIYDSRGTATADLVTLDDHDPYERPIRLVHPSFPEVTRTLSHYQVSEVESLRVKVLEDGMRVSGDVGDIGAARRRRSADLARLDPGVRRLVNPHTYHVSLSQELSDLKQDLIAGFKS